MSNDTLIATFQPTEQRLATLTVDKAKNTSYAFTAEQAVFNVDEYMDKFGRSAVAELGASVEGDVATLAETAPYRFFGDGTTAIDSYDQLATALAYFDDYGSAKTNIKGVLPTIAVPSIIGSGLNQFATDRNNEIAVSWMVGSFANCEWYKSNRLPLHVSGVTGQVGSTDIKVVSINPAGDQLTLNIASLPSEPNAFKANDSLQFKDGVGPYIMRYLTFIGHTTSSNPVQVRVTADAGTDGSGNVTVSIYPALISTAGNANQNIPSTTPVVADLELTAFPDHRCGVIWSGNALYLGMPQLPDESPFFTVSKIDPDSGASIRMYMGSKFGLNERGTVNDVIWGKLLVPEYSMKLMFPATV